MESSAEIGVRLSTPHQMIHTETQDHGAEEWSCTECNRRLLLRRPPAFEKIVLERGDEWAAHAGNTGALEMSATSAHRADAGDLPGYDRGWLADHGIEWRADDTP
jgi:hypothetical protein